MTDAATTWPLLDEILVCPVCSGALPLDHMRRCGTGRCLRCARSYLYREGIFDLIPVPPPDEEVMERWGLWEKLQANGCVAYERCPEENLSVGARQDARAFEAFCELRGPVLDVGCGPQTIPSYGTAFDGQLTGIDPLRGVQPRRFAFVQGIGEFLPFPAATFDRVLFGTSLDHILNPRRALAEARRVVTPEGAVNIWFDGEAGSRWRRRFGAAVAMLRRGEIRELAERTTMIAGLRARSPVVPAYCAGLTVPDGAADHFHFESLHHSTLHGWLEEASLAVDEIHQAQETTWFVRALPR